MDFENSWQKELENEGDIADIFFKLHFVYDISYLKANLRSTNIIIFNVIPWLPRLPATTKRALSHLSQFYLTSFIFCV
jgi:hypothetical protein